MDKIEYVKSIIHENCLPPPPPDWRIFDDGAGDRGGGGMPHRIEATGYVLATKRGIVTGECADGHKIDRHFALSSAYFQTKASEIKFIETQFGGLSCRWPAQIARSYVKQFHCFDCSTDFEWLEKLAGSHVKIKIEGWLMDARSSDPDLRWTDFTKFDRSNRCPTITLERVSLVGEVRARDIISFRIPFTRKHITIAGIKYDRPADFVTQEPQQQQVLRAAAR